MSETDGPSGVEGAFPGYGAPSSARVVWVSRRTIMQSLDPAGQMAHQGDDPVLLTLLRGLGLKQSRRNDTGGSNYEDFDYSPMRCDTRNFSPVFSQADRRFGREAN